MRNSDGPNQDRSKATWPETESADGEPVERRSPDLEGGDRSMDPEDMTLEDVIDAEDSRPSLPDETSDGLDDMDEEIRRQAEDRPSDRQGRE